MIAASITRPVRRRTAVLATGYGLMCHATFGIAVVAMIVVLFTGMQAGQGRLAAPWSWVADALLLLQFPLVHTALLSRRGGAIMRRLVPASVGVSLLPTTYALLASIQTLALFAGWTPIGRILWQAQGAAFVACTLANAAAWLFLGKAIMDAGAGLQTGLIGWRAVARGTAPAYPPMPTRGLFAWTRQPIYLGFAMTTWTVPTITPDGLAVAVVLTGYCVLGPLFKEARFRRRFGAPFAAYQARVPYWLPDPRRLSARVADARTAARSAPPR